MPIFEYKCDDCETKFEKLVRRADEKSAVPTVWGESFDDAVFDVRGSGEWEVGGGGDAVVSGRDVQDAGHLRSELRPGGSGSTDADDGVKHPLTVAARKDLRESHADLEIRPTLLWGVVDSGKLDGIVRSHRYRNRAY